MSADLNSHKDLTDLETVLFIGAGNSRVVSKIIQKFKDLLFDVGTSSKILTGLKFNLIF